MFLITGSVKVQDHKRDQMIAAVRKMVAASRQEEGCQACRYAVDVDDPTTITFHEAWASPDAAKAHSQTTHMAEFGQAMMQLVASPPQVTAWQAESVPMG